MDDVYIIVAPDRTDLYWRANRCGYTNNLAYAGIYTQAEAERIEALQRGDVKVAVSSMKKDFQEQLRTARHEVANLENVMKNYINGRS
jgi:hypothetical protein